MILMILATSFVSLFKVNKENPSPALTASFLLIFLSNLFTTFDVKLLTNLGKLSLAKGIAIFVSDFFLKLANQAAILIKRLIDHLIKLFQLFELYKVFYLLTYC